MEAEKGVFVVGGSKRYAEEGDSPATLWDSVSRTQMTHMSFGELSLKAMMGNDFKRYNSPFDSFLRLVFNYSTKGLIIFIGFLLSLF